jgi:hypothetical protein
MKRIKVKSTSIDSIGFNKKTLEIKFIKNKAYKYFNVTEAIFVEFCLSKSKGKYYNKNIKNNPKYRL